MTSQKLENLLNLALNSAEDEREKSLNLNVGYDPLDREWDLIIKYSVNLDRVRKIASKVTELQNEYAVIRITESRIDILSGIPEVEYVEKPKRLFFQAAEGRRVSCINAVQDTRLSLYGQGILVAIIDSGIDYANIDFRNADGSTRIRYLWDQSLNPADGETAPVGYSIGVEYTKGQIDEALNAQTVSEQRRLVRSQDISGHGTAVAGVAAGNGRNSGGRYAGVAMQSELIVVKLGNPIQEGFPRTTELMMGIDYIIRKALELRMPVAVNISFGNTYGSHSGTSLLETYLDYVSNLGRINIVVGSGNEGNNGGHASARLASLESARIEFAVGNYESSLSIQIWKNYWDDIRFQLTPPGLGTSFKIPNQPGSWRFSFGTTQILVYYGLPSPYSLYQEIAIDLLPRRDYISGGVWFFTAEARSVIEGIIDLWMPAAAIRGTATQFLTPTTETTLTIPSTAGNVITVGAYNSFTNTLAPFSGRGYTWNTGQVKPDLVAPGVDITSCAVGGGYESRSGTSMAAPFVSGSCALLMQWGILQNNDPFLYGEKMKAYLIRGARQLPFSVSYPNPQSGYGALCVSSSLTFV